jgi:hypothetical protein
VTLLSLFAGNDATYAATFAAFAPVSSLAGMNPPPATIWAATAWAVSGVLRSGAELALAILGTRGDPHCLD